eukprot:scaffold2175_cov381-Prasinococcus_capsulatus_cf.AAC.12
MTLLRSEGLCIDGKSLDVQDKNPWKSSDLVAHSKRSARAMLALLINSIFLEETLQQFLHLKPILLSRDTSLSVQTSTVSGPASRTGEASAA